MRPDMANQTGGTQMSSHDQELPNHQCVCVRIATVQILENCANRRVVKTDRTKRTFGIKCTQSGRAGGCSLSEFGFCASEVVTAAAP